MIAKLSSAKGTAGYDVVVPTGIYIPEMAKNKLLMELNLAAIPNFQKLEASFTKQPWDATNKYTVCKDWGTTGYVYNTTVIKRELTSWADFVDAAGKEASGQTSLLDDPQEIMGIWAFANGKNWNTTDTADLDAAEAYLTALAKHIKAFVSYPSSDMAAGKYALCHAWNGDARQGILSTKNPADWKWVFPSPKTTLWMDNWAIPAGAKNVNAAHAFINYILDPVNSLKEVEFIGYHTGIAGIEEQAKAANFKMLDLVFFTKDQVATMVAGEINASLQRRVNILTKAKAAATA
jgi:spermidine/putrescine transport system substrate-binding protein